MTKLAHMWRKVTHAATWSARLVSRSKTVVATIALVDFVAHTLMLILHVTQHAYPGSPSEVFAVRITAITYFTPWHYFHLTVMVIYLASAVVDSNKGLKFAVTMSWAIWSLWSILMLIWVITAPVSWIPLVMGIVMSTMTALAREAWVEKVSSGGTVREP